MNQHKTYFCLFITLLILVACQDEIQVSPEVQQPDSNLITVTIESTLVNMTTPTSIPTNVPTMASTPMLTPSSLLPTPTIFPVFTPSGDATNFQLKEWSEPLALTLVDETEKYAQEILHADMDLYFQRVGFIEAHEIVELAAKEAILRFPGTKSNERLQWLIVLSESLLSGPYWWQPPDEKFLDLLEMGLNDGSYELNDLNTGLNPFGFEVRTITPYGKPIPQFAANLFGDGQTVPMVVISRIDDSDPHSVDYVDDDGFIVAVKKDEQNEYTPLLIQSGWSRVSSGFDSIKVADVTADDIPEIEVVFSVHSGSISYRYISVWSWRNNEFVDLVDEIVLSAAQWHFYNDLDGTPSLETNDYIIGVGGPITTIYSWNGDIFEPVSIEVTDWPDDVPVPTLPSNAPIQQSTATPENTISETDITHMESRLLENGDTEAVISLLEPLLASSDFDRMGRYTIPRLYYLLGLAYELNGDERKAVNNYWFIWQNYPDSPYSILVQAKLEEKASGE